MAYILLRARTFGPGEGRPLGRIVPHRWLAETIGCDVRTVERSCSALVELGYASRWKRSGRGLRLANYYYAYDIRPFEDGERIWERDAEDERIRQEAIDDAAQELRREAEPVLQASIRAEVEAQIRAEVEADLRARIRAEVEADLRARIRAELEAELRVEKTASTAHPGEKDTGAGAVDNNSGTGDGSGLMGAGEWTPMSGDSQKSRIRNYPYIPTTTETSKGSPDPSIDNNLSDEHDLSEMEAWDPEQASRSLLDRTPQRNSLFTEPEAEQSWSTFASSLNDSRSPRQAPAASEAISDPVGRGGTPAFSRPNSVQTPEDTVSWLTWYVFNRLDPSPDLDEQNLVEHDARARILADIEELRRPREPREGFLSYLDRTRQADALEQDLETSCRPLWATPSGAASDPTCGGELDLLSRCAEPDDDLIIDAVGFLRQHRHTGSAERWATGGTLDDTLMMASRVEEDARLRAAGPGAGRHYTGTLRKRTIRACLQAVYRLSDHLPQAMPAHEPRAAK